MTEITHVAAGIEGEQKHYLLIKREGYDPQGKKLSAHFSASALLTAGIWPLWSQTRNRLAIRTGDKLAVYLSGPGNQTVIATARVKKIGPWTRSMASEYPLSLDGTPFSVLYLADVLVLDNAIKVSERLGKISFITKDAVTGRPKQKWGVAFMGGTRSLNAVDFQVLTT